MVNKMLIGGHTIKISNPKKILFPKSKLTKQELINYYAKIAKYMLPYLKNRPISMHRFPNGVNKEGFFQKQADDYFPEWITLQKIKKGGGSLDQVVCNNTATLAYLANLACITIHTWLSTIKKINYPDKMIFDLDPPDNNFTLAKLTAKKLKSLLENKLKLKTFVMLTGSKGLHVIVPLKQKENFEEVRTFARNIAELLVKNNPKLTTEQRLEKRKGKLLIDILRNAYAQTSVAPYSIRENESASIATPISWIELKSIKHSNMYTIKTIFTRLKKANPWQDINKSKKSLISARKKLNKLLN